MATVATSKTVPFTKAPSTSIRPYPNVRRGSAGRCAPIAATSASVSAKRSMHTCTASLVSAKLRDAKPPQNSITATAAVNPMAKVRLRRTCMASLGFESFEREREHHRTEGKEGFAFRFRDNRRLPLPGPVGHRLELWNHRRHALAITIELLAELRAQK